MKVFVLIESKELEGFKDKEGFEVNSYPVTDKMLTSMYGEGCRLVNYEWYELVRTLDFNRNYIDEIIDEVKNSEDGYVVVEFERPVRLNEYSEIAGKDVDAVSFYFDEGRELVIVKCSDCTEHSMGWFFDDDRFEIAKGIGKLYYGE